MHLSGKSISINSIIALMRGKNDEHLLLKEHSSVFIPLRVEVAVGKTKDTN